MKLILTFIVVICSFGGFAQKVGIVFSGGGATGFAHIGVLKALEEHEIPIDYITGTSAGALVGALYSSGYSPKEIEILAQSESFYLMSQGILEEKNKFYFHKEDLNSEILSVKFAKDSIFQKSLPTNLLNSTYLDIELMSLLATNPIKAYKSFDSLFIPFRCIASDIVNKKSVMFDKGNLNTAVRASMTYPFFLSPIRVNNQLLFDGGLYNNFPAQELINEFNVDYIIGSNVSYNEPEPTEDDLMSQVRNLFSQHSNYSLPCENGILIEPALEDIGTFDFAKIKEAIEIGYQATLLKIDSIKISISRKVTKKMIEDKRKKYLSEKIKLSISEITTTGLSDEEKNYFNNKFLKNKNNDYIDYETLKSRYLKLYQSEHIYSFFPSINHYNDSSQSLNLYVRKEKPFNASFGGHFSSRPVNTGFLKLSYSDFKLTPITIYGNAYFGNFYGSVKAGLKLFLPTHKEVYIEPYYVQSRWDYFSSFATFFEDVKPSYLILEESFWGAKLATEFIKRSKLEFSIKNGVNDYNYYQTTNDINIDTADFTNILYYSPGIKIEFNTLNRKEFGSLGKFFSFESRFVHAIESSIAGSTGANIDLDNTFRNWFYIHTKFTKYFQEGNFYRLGLYAEGYYAYKPFLQNYSITNLSSKQFNPFPDSKNMFFSDFRSNEFASVGLINIFTLKDKLDLRIEAYIFQPIRSLLNEDGNSAYSKPFSETFNLGSVSLIYYSLVGPVRATLDYYGEQVNPITFQLSYGFSIFNERGIK